MKKIRNIVRNIIKESLSSDEDRFYGVSSSKLNFLLDNPGFFKTVDPIIWCSKNIGTKLGSGATRSVFNLVGNNDLVFKVATNLRDGVETNLKEIKFFTEYGFQSPFFPRVYLHDYMGEWLVVEKLNLLINNQMSMEDAYLQFEPYVKQNAKMLSNLPYFIGKFLEGQENKEEKLNILLSLANEYYGVDVPAYYFFDMAMTRVWAEDIWKWQAVDSFSQIDLYNYFNSNHEKALSNLFDFLMTDPWLASLGNAVKQIGIDWGDIGPGNIAIDESGNIKIIDISIFDDKSDFDEQSSFDE